MTRSSKALLCLAASLTLVACATNSPVERPTRPTAPVTTPGSTATAPVVATPAVPEKSPNEQFEEALAALKARKFQDARNGFEKLAKEHPEFSGPLTNLGILDAKADARQAAVRNFSRAVANNPRNAIAYNWLGILYREIKAYGSAENAYLKSIAADPSNPAVVLNLAILYDVYMNRPVDALARYREYQTLTGNRELKVTAWIKAIELALPPEPATAPAAANPVSPQT